MTAEKKKILEMVQEGTLSAEEALILLENLGKEGPKESALPQQVFSERAKKEDTEKQASLKGKLFDFLDMAVKKVKDIDLEFNFANSAEVRHIFQYPDSDAGLVDIEVANGSVKLVPWNENDIRIECAGKVFKAENEEEARQTFMHDVIASLENGILRFIVQKKLMKISTIIYLPNKTYDLIKIRMFNGPISSEGIAAKDLTAKTANGSIQFEKITAGRLELETANGQITVKDGAGEVCEAETINGAVRVTGSYEKADLKSFSGAITCTFEDKRCQTAHLKTTTGSIEVYVPDEMGIEGELKSNIGNFKLDIPHIEIVEEKSEVIQKMMKIKANTNEPILHLFADSKAGAISIKGAVKES